MKDHVAVSALLLLCTLRQGEFEKCKFVRRKETRIILFFFLAFSFLSLNYCMKCVITWRSENGSRSECLAWMHFSDENKRVIVKYLIIIIIILIIIMHIIFITVYQSWELQGAGSSSWQQCNNSKISPEVEPFQAVHFNTKDDHREHLGCWHETILVPSPLLHLQSKRTRSSSSLVLLGAWFYLPDPATCDFWLWFTIKANVWGKCG